MNKTTFFLSGIVIAVFLIHVLLASTQKTNGGGLEVSASRILIKDSVGNTRLSLFYDSQEDTVNLYLNDSNGNARRSIVVDSDGSTRDGWFGSSGKLMIGVYVGNDGETWVSQEGEIGNTFVRSAISADGVHSFLTGGKLVKEEEKAAVTNIDDSPAGK